MQAHVYNLLLQERLQRIVLPIVLHQYHLCMAYLSRNAPLFDVAASMAGRDNLFPVEAEGFAYDMLTQQCELGMCYQP